MADDGFIFVLVDELWTTQIVEVLVVRPKFEVLTFSLVASNLVKYTQVCGAVIRAKVCNDFPHQRLLLFGKIFSHVDLLISTAKGVLDRRALKQCFSVPVLFLFL